MHAPPAVRGTFPQRLVVLAIGLFCCAVGLAMMLEAKLGLAPWDVLHQGIAKNTPLNFGEANIAVGLVVVVVAWRLGAKIGVGTIANATLIGLFINQLLGMGFVQELGRQGVAVRAPLLVGGILMMGLGTALYMGAAMGAGPRDSLMVVAAQRTHRRIGLVRGAIELAVLVVGVALGGKVGVGTVLFAVGIGPVCEAWFWSLQRSPLAVRRPEPVHTPAVG